METTFMPNTSFDSITENEEDNARKFWGVVLATWQWRLRGQIFLYCSPVIVFIGTIGNVLALVVLLRSNLRQKSTFVYLAGVAIADLLVLYTLSFTQWIALIAEIRILTRSNWLCKPMVFVGSASSQYSVWLIVLVTAERLVVVVCPLRAQVLCQRSRCLVAMAALLAVVLAVNGHKFWTFSVRNNSCEETEEYKHLARTVFFWVDTSVYSLVPFAVILSLNLLIIVWTKRAKQTRLSISSRSRAVDDGSRRLTIMLLTLSFTFLLTTAPNCITIIYFHLALKPDSGVEKTHQFYANSFLAMTICQQTIFVNHAINFFLYCLVGKKFREELLSALPARLCTRESRDPAPSQTLELN